MAGASKGIHHAEQLDIQILLGPFNANVNSLHVQSQRLMLNGYKDIPINPWLSFYGMAGVGVARIEAEGYQTNETRRFASNRQHHFAYSVGMGLKPRSVSKSRWVPAIVTSQWAMLKPATTPSQTV